MKVVGSIWYTHYRTTCTDTTSAPTKRSVKHSASPTGFHLTLHFSSIFWICVDLWMWWPLTVPTLVSQAVRHWYALCTTCAKCYYFWDSALLCGISGCMHGVCGWWLWMTVEAYNQLVVWVQHILLLHLMPAVEVNSGQRSCMGLPVVHDVTVKLNNLSPHPTTPLMHAPLHVMLAAAAVYLTAQQHRSRHHICRYC